jgi:hypothetical protein
LELVAHHQSQHKFETGQDDDHVPELFKQLYIWKQLVDEHNSNKKKSKNGSKKGGSKKGVVSNAKSAHNERLLATEFRLIGCGKLKEHNAKVLERRALKETVSDITVDDYVKNWCKDDEIISISSLKKLK